MGTIVPPAEVAKRVAIPGGIGSTSFAVEVLS
jgi:hypothetical protein